jgi:hypothetical protein
VSFFRWFGLGLSLFAGTVGYYEAAAILTPLPTLSRLMQGLRDGGHTHVIFFISLVFVCTFAVFGAWLYYHLNYQPRSGN